MVSPMHIITTAAALAAYAAAATIPVSVGKNGLTFEPNVIHAYEGDVIEFRFWPRNHSVVAGDFANACEPAADGGFYSGFFPTQPGTVNSQVFRVTVSHTNPVPVYCSQNNGQHCKNGMVAVINPHGGGGQLTLDAYAALARQAGNATSPGGGPFGGQVAPNEAATASGTATGTGTATTTRTRTGSETGTQTETETETATETETDTATDTDTDTATATDTATTTGAGGAGGTSTSTTTGATGTTTGNAAAGVAVPVVGLVAMAVGVFFV